MNFCLCVSFSGRDELALLLSGVRGFLITACLGFGAQALEHRFSSRGVVRGPSLAPWHGGIFLDQIDPVSWQVDY